MDSIRRLLFWLLEGTKGGNTRIKILNSLMKKPANIRQLSIACKLDYKTTEHHINLMMKNSMLESEGNKYGRVYFISEKIIAEKDFLKLIEKSE